MTTQKKPQQKNRKNSRRGAANSRFLRARSRVLRPAGPYRPRRAPRPARDLGVRTSWLWIFLMLLAFALGHVWKEQQVSQLCTRIDQLRAEQEHLQQECLTLQLKFDDLASYSAIEPLARQKLGMRALPLPPVVITPVDGKFLAYKRSDR